MNLKLFVDRWDETIMWTISKDGSVGWVLSVIDQIKFLHSPPSVAVLPLGTGNDLARALNWGGGYTDEALTKIFAKIMEARTVKLDRWKISTWPNTEAPIERNHSSANASGGTFDSSDESTVSSIRNDVMNNYFSIGADAHVCLEFHERRGFFLTHWLIYFESFLSL